MADELDNLVLKMWIDGVCHAFVPATTITRLTEANAAQAREIEGLRAWRDNEAVPTLAAIRVSCFNWDEHTGRHFHTMIRDVLVAAQSTITGGQP